MRFRMAYLPTSSRMLKAATQNAENCTFSIGDNAWLLPIGDGVWRVIEISLANEDRRCILGELAPASAYGHVDADGIHGRSCSVSFAFAGAGPRTCPSDLILGHVLDSQDNSMCR
jgi:hypothetical protein